MAVPAVNDTSPDKAKQSDSKNGINRKINFIGTREASIALLSQVCCAWNPSHVAANMGLLCNIVSLISVIHYSGCYSQWTLRALHVWYVTKLL